MELIDRKEVLYQLHKQSQIDSQPRAIRRARRIVSDTPAVEAIPIEWIENFAKTKFAMRKDVGAWINWMIENWRDENENG